MKYSRALNHHLLIPLLLLILLLGAFLRFYKLDWGNGLFAHPDEYHIVISVNQLSFPSQMNPHFFSYGTVVIYLIYFTKLLLSPLYPLSPFLIGRFYSALFSTLTLIVVYKISRHFLTTHYSLLTTLLVALTPGLIQQAHFLTPESALIFFLFSCLLFSLKYLKSPKILIASCFLGLALGVKVSAFPFILIPLLAALIKRRFFLIPLILLSLLIPLLLFSPFIFLAFPHFWENISYESSLAAGHFVVFYTRQFINTTPFLFQLEKIYPYALGPGLLIFGLLGLISSLKDLKSPKILILILSFLILLIPNSLLFTKWTRFISPTFPFFALFAVYPLKYLKSPKLLKVLPLILLILLTLLSSLAFFSIYTKPDVRLTASDWIVSHLPEGSKILVEGGNTIDIPLSGNFQRTSLDFYNLDADPLEFQQVNQALLESDYFIVQSRRVFANHQRLPNLFPKTAKLYDDLFAGRFGYRQIKEFDSFPTIFGFTINDENAEETWSVFDHPVIRIFQKI